MNDQEKLEQLVNAYEKAFFHYNPEIGLEREDVDQSRFTDRSIAALEAWYKTEDGFLAELNELDENALRGTTQYQSYKLLRGYIENSKASRILKNHLWDMSDQGVIGWFSSVINLTRVQPVGSVSNQEKAVLRWKSFSKVVDDAIDNLNQGILEGYTAPKVIVKAVIDQLTSLFNTPIKESVFYDIVKRNNERQKNQGIESSAFEIEMDGVIQDVIYPALRKYVAFLENTYLSLARSDIGLSALPNGVRGYEATIRQHSTLEISPEAIIAYGQEHMKQLALEVAAIGERLFGQTDMSEVFRLAKLETFKTEEDIIQYNLKALERAKGKMSDWFNLMPKAECTIEPYPLFLAESGASGEYLDPSEDETRPGIFYINTYRPETKSRMDQEAILFHELMPGHHYQCALASEDKSHHPFEKYLWNAGFGEGWALYVERLSDEMRLYLDPISRLGMLLNEALRTARLVVDPGIHVMGWTKEQAFEYMRANTGLDPCMIHSEINRYIVWPGQAVSYMLGKREIENLRAVAQERLLDKFDIKAFHDQVVKNGCVTLPMLKSQIYEWLENACELDVPKTPLLTAYALQEASEPLAQVSELSQLRSRIASIK